MRFGKHIFSGFCGVQICRPQCHCVRETPKRLKLKTVTSRTDVSHFYITHGCFFSLALFPLQMLLAGRGWKDLTHPRTAAVQPHHICVVFFVIFLRRLYLETVLKTRKANTHTHTPSYHSSSVVCSFVLLLPFRCHFLFLLVCVQSLPAAGGTRSWRDERNASGTKKRRNGTSRQALWQQTCLPTCATFGDMFAESAGSGARFSLPYGWRHLGGSDKTSGLN